jgi:hypothetical protein
MQQQPTARRFCQRLMKEEGKEAHEKSRGGRLCKYTQSKKKPINEQKKNNIVELRSRSQHRHVRE